MDILLWPFELILRAYLHVYKLFDMFWIVSWRGMFECSRHTAVEIIQMYRRMLYVFGWSIAVSSIALIIFFAIAVPVRTQPYWIMWAVHGMWCVGIALWIFIGLCRFVNRRGKAWNEYKRTITH